MSEPEAAKPSFVERMRAQRETHRERSKIVRFGFVIVGFTVLLAGIAMMVLPGPALAVIPIGLAILSLEFAWAERLLERALVKGDEARRKAASATPAQKALSAAAVILGVAAAVAAAIVWDIPYVPV